MTDETQPPEYEQGELPINVEDERLIELLRKSGVLDPAVQEPGPVDAIAAGALAQQEAERKQREAETLRARRPRSQ